MRYTQFTDDQVQHALTAIGVDSIDDLFAPIEPSLRLKDPLNIPAGVSELEMLRDVETLASRNQDCAKLTCFLGGGAYDHFIPTVVDALAAQSEFLTAYTPYQAEASQGILQLFFEFQTMVCQLTGMEIANASMYEVASAAVEAVGMATAITGRKRVLVARNVHPDTRRVLRTYADSQNLEVVSIADKGGVVDQAALTELLDESIAAVLLQSPNLFGCVERLDQIVDPVHSAGALAIVSTDPLAGGVFKTIGEFGVDIVVAEGQALGVPLQYGGPYLGLLAGREKYLRKMPGRLVGMAKDQDGTRGFCLVLQTREQHIKRERATSNICTNEGLLAVRAAIYMASMGKKGIGEVASQCFDKAHYAATQVAKLPGFELRFEAPFFKEFVVRTDHDVPTVLNACRKKGILGGIRLADLDDRWEDCFLVAVTEKRTKEQIDQWVGVLAGI